MGETPSVEAEGEVQSFKIDTYLVTTSNVMDLEGMIIYKAHINDGGMHFTGYGNSRGEAAIVALNKCAG